MKKRFPSIVKTALVSLYLIFLAGSFVRMTGSGMGCPDWPKCFGHYIPPTSQEQLRWRPNTLYKKGMIIVKDEMLFVAEKQVETRFVFNSNNWEKYTKHEYATFNKFHTWVEYINRLVTVLSGLIVLLMCVCSLGFWKQNKWIPAISFAALILMGVEAILGKMVVDSNLRPMMITIHMLVGLLIIGLVLRLLFIIRKGKTTHRYHALFNRILVVSIIFSLIQIAMGTQVRQFIDEQVKLFGFENKQYSLMHPSIKFYIHRSFTIAIVLVNVGLFYLNLAYKSEYRLVNWVLVLLFLEAITGILMYYASFPMGTQSVHLISGALLFGVQMYLWQQHRAAYWVIKKQNTYYTE